jgi:ABC-type bacteriocin/lantibiotic exporter with double-glycine peptidase domain
LKGNAMSEKDISEELRELANECTLITIADKLNEIADRVEKTNKNRGRSNQYIEELEQAYLSELDKRIDEMTKRRDRFKEIWEENEKNR